MNSVPRTDVSGVILAGGQSRRMGSNKALLDVAGRPLIAQVFGVMADLFAEVMVVTNTPEPYRFLGARLVPDVYPGFGSIAGVHAGLRAAATERICVVPCDAPFLNPALLSLLCDVRGDYDAVVPRSDHGIEPLQAVYRRSCLAVLEEAIDQQRRALHKLLDRLRCCYIEPEQYQHLGDVEQSFCNLNYPADYEALQPGRRSRS